MGEEDGVGKAYQFLLDHPELVNDEDYALRLVAYRCDGDSKSSVTLGNAEARDLLRALSREDFRRGCR